MHKRVWSVAGPFSPEQLADRLTRFDFTSCTGFECGGLYFLNDSTSPDSIQEYAVIRKSNLEQVESLTVMGLSATKESVLAHIKRLVESDELESFTSYCEVERRQIDLSDEHHCRHCA
jgi:hypothetical protein